MYPPELEPNIGTEYGYDSEISIKLVWDQMNKKNAYNTFSNTWKEGRVNCNNYSGTIGCVLLILLQHFLS